MWRARGERWEGGREKRGLCHIMCGSALAGFAVLWFWLNQPTFLDAFERCCEDKCIKG